MRYQLTRHAEHVLAERGIALEALEQTLTAPQWTEPDPADATVQRYLRSIPQFRGRVLRVAVDHTAHPVRVVCMFFDRSAKGKA